MCMRRHRFYHHTSKRPHVFKSGTMISSGEQCPRCRQRFGIVRRVTCLGCNTEYFTDDPYKLGDRFVCPINGESVVQLNEGESALDSKGAGGGKPSQNTSVIKLAALTLGGIALLCVILQILNVPALVLPGVVYAVTVAGVALLAAAALIGSFYVVVFLLPSFSSWIDRRAEARIEQMLTDGTLIAPPDPPDHNEDVVGKLDKITKGSLEEVRGYALSGRKALIGQRVVNVLLINVIVIIAFNCYYPRITPTVTVIEPYIIGIQTFQIGSISTFIFGAIYYAGTFLFNLDDSLRKRVDMQM